MNRRADAGHRLQQAHAAFAGGDIATAFAIAGQVLSHIPSANEARVLRLNAAVKLERWQDAIADLDMLIAAHPQQAKLHKTLALCWLRVGNAYKAQGNFDAAVDAYRKAIGADAGCHDARFNLGVLLLEHQRPHEAVVLLRHMLERTPADVAAALKLAEAQIATGDNAAAIELLGRIAHEHDRATLQQVSKLLLQAGSGDAAKSLACRVIKEQSGVEAWAREFCRQLRNYSDLDGSRELLSLLRRHTGDAIECLRIDMADALGLPSTYPDAATLQSTRQHFIGRLGQFTSDYPPARIAALAPPAETLLWDNFYLAYQGENDRDPQRRFGEWLSASLSALTARATATANTRARSQHKLPRLAMVSSRFHECTVGAYFSSWVEHLAGAGWEVILTHVGGYRDHVTERMATKPHGELTLTGNIVENAQKLGELDANLILYPELGMDYRTSALAAQRLAGVQVCAWGHPVTTGLPTIDAFLSCAEMEPTDA